MDAKQFLASRVSTALQQAARAETASVTLFYALYDLMREGGQALQQIGDPGELLVTEGEEAARSTTLLDLASKTLGGDSCSLGSPQEAEEVSWL